MGTLTMNKTSRLEQLKKFTRVAADTADFETMRAYNAQEGTTNPSLILAAAQKPDYGALLDRAVSQLKNISSDRSAKADAVMDNLMVNFGVEILNIVLGRISTEVDVRLSFDCEGSINKGKHLISLYEKQEKADEAACDAIRGMLDLVDICGEVAGRYRVEITPDMGGDWTASLSLDGPQGPSETSFTVNVRP
jgi:hypothetical protein